MEHEKKPKLSDNTNPKELDVVANPVYQTAIDRYLIAAHWTYGQRVLDLSTGYGYGAGILKSLGAKYVLGVDRDSKAIKWAQENLSAPHLQFLEHDLFTFKEAGSDKDKFDVVVSIETMEHLPKEKVQEYLKILKAHCKVKGTVLITTPNRKTKEFKYVGGTHLYEYNIEEFYNELNNVFDEVEVRPLLEIYLQQFNTYSTVLSNDIKLFEHSNVILGICKNGKN